MEKGARLILMGSTVLIYYRMYYTQRGGCAARNLFFSLVCGAVVYIEKRRRSNIYSLSPLFSKEIKK
jgi:hypothetical protein